MTCDGATRRASTTETLETFATALPEVYGYLLARCGDRWLAEDLTSEALTAAVAAIQRGMIEEVTVAWLTVVARRRLIDHWRRSRRLDERTRDLERAIDPIGDGRDEGWEEPLDAVRCRCAMARLAGPHRAALTLRYVDGLSVGDVALSLGRGYEATEALLYRARAALRRAYEQELQHG
jgi:RNA polymerase sigma-70 factor (ECF subfamily)